MTDPETGAIFRCELDGKNLEVIAKGLRNPQEIAFDDYGNLFCADNNSDSGDLARWLHVVAGGDYGWRMPYQYFTDRGPWNRERLWDVENTELPPYTLPPVANFADGPAGLAHYPGTGLSPAYNGNFFLADFRGEAGISGIRTFKVRPRGSTFELIDPELFVWNCLATDVDFGPDGSIYVSDWIEGWQGTGKGRIYRLYDPEYQQQKVVEEVRQLLARGLRKQSTSNLTQLLSHVDGRLRREAQFELARREDVATLTKVAHQSRVVLAKLHAIWGLGQVGRLGGKGKSEQALNETITLLREADAELRVAALTVLGDNRYAPAANAASKRLYDDSPRVRCAAAIAMGRIKSPRAVEPLLDLAVANSDADPILRHACVMGLVGCAAEEELKSLATHQDPAVRLVAVLTLRRRESVGLVDFLADEDEIVATAAARAIHDVPVPALFPQLAEMVHGEFENDAFLRRCSMLISSWAPPRMRLLWLNSPPKKTGHCHFASLRWDCSAAGKPLRIAIESWGCGGRSRTPIKAQTPWRRSAVHCLN